MSQEEQPSQGGQDTTSGQDPGGTVEPAPTADPDAPIFPLPDMDYELREGDRSGREEK